MRRLIFTIALITIVAAFSFCCKKKEEPAPTAETGTIGPEPTAEPIPTAETASSAEGVATAEEMPTAEEAPETPATAEEAPETAETAEAPATAEPGTAEAPDVEPPEEAYDEALNTRLDDMKRDVRFESAIPPEMKIYETTTVKLTARFAGDKPIEPDIEIKETEEGKIRLERFTIKTTPTIIAQLLPVDNNFEIDPEGEVEQYLEPGGSCPWEWSVTAKKRGPQKLLLKISYRVRDQRDREKTVNRESEHKVVTVKVGGNWLEYFWREYWKIIVAVLGAISLVLGIILSIRKLLKRNGKD